MTSRTPESLRELASAANERAARLERQLEHAQKITHIGSWEWDLATNSVTWSDELYRIYGLEPRSCEITFETFVSRLHPEDRARVQDEVRQALERRTRFSYPERIVRPDGSIRELDTVGEVACDAAGRVIGLIGTCRDVTEERKRTEMIQRYADIVRNVQIGLVVWRVADSDAPEAATLQAFNPAAEGVLGLPLEDKIGRRVGEVFPAPPGPDFLAFLASVAREERVQELPGYRPIGPGNASRTFMLKGFPLPGRCVGVAFEDVTLHERALALQSSEQRVLEMVAAGEPLEHVLNTLALAIEEQAPAAIASILLLDGMHVHHGAGPNLPAAYRRAIDGAAIGPRAGACGAAAFLKQPVFTKDIETDSAWEHYRELALPHGLRACWSTPIFSSDARVLGTFALYYGECRLPEPYELQLIARATHVAGIAIQRKQLDEQLLALSAHTEAAREEERTAMAREIHDELGQALTALKMDVAWIQRRVSQGSPDVRSVEQKLSAMSKMTDDIIDHVRRISAELRPGVLDDLGLVAAIEWQAQQFQERTGTTCLVHSNLRDERLDRRLSTTVFRIFQEALTNVARHAQAEVVEVELKEVAARPSRVEPSRVEPVEPSRVEPSPVESNRVQRRLQLRVRDDGKGISAEAISSRASLGLLGVRERARQLGGNVEVSGSAGQGTLVVLDLPFSGGGTH